MTIEAEVLAVLADTCRHGRDSASGTEVLDRGIRELLAKHPHYELLGLAMCGWAGLISAQADLYGYSTDRAIELYRDSGVDA